MTESATVPKPPGSRTIARRKARLAAVQALYQMDLAQTDLNRVIGEFAALRFSEDAEDKTVSGADGVFFAELLKGVVRRQKDLDPMLDQQLAEGWRLVRVDSTMRAILRGGIYELMERKDVPARAVINEYVEVANAFFDADEPKVVNGVLDKLARRLRPTEFEPAAES